MAKTGEELEKSVIEVQVERIPEEKDKQAWLIKLAERTVLQAETLAQEITDHAKQESEVEGAKLLERYKAEAKEEARRIIEAAEQLCVTLTNGATSKAQVETGKILGKAQTHGLEIVSDAQAEGQEIIDRAQREASAITDAAKARAESVESNSRLSAESIIRQMSQNVADAIHRAVVESRKQIPPALEELGGQVREEPFADQNDSYAILREELSDKTVSYETQGDSPATGEPSAANGTHLAEDPSPRRGARSSGAPEASASGEG